MIVGEQDDGWWWQRIGFNKIFITTLGHILTENTLESYDKMVIHIINMIFRYRLFYHFISSRFRCFALPHSNNNNNSYNNGNTKTAASETKIEFQQTIFEHCSHRFTVNTFQIQFYVGHNICTNSNWCAQRNHITIWNLLLCLLGGAWQWTIFTNSQLILIRLAVSAREVRRNNND